MERPFVVPQAASIRERLAIALAWTQINPTIALLVLAASLAKTDTVTAVVRERLRAAHASRTRAFLAALCAVVLLALAHARRQVVARIEERRIPVGDAMIGDPQQGTQVARQRRFGTWTIGTHMIDGGDQALQ